MWRPANPQPAATSILGPEVRVRRILVIEQRDQIAALARATLSAQDWAVEVASDAVSAMKLLWDTVFSLIVVDIQLPDDGALDVVRVLHENDVRAAVLLLANRDDVLAAFSGLRD